MSLHLEGLSRIGNRYPKQNSLFVTLERKLLTYYRAFPLEIHPTEKLCDGHRSLNGEQLYLEQQIVPGPLFVHTISFFTFNF